MLWLSSSSSSINQRSAAWPDSSRRASKHAYPCAVASGSLFHPARRLHTRSRKTAGCEKQQKPPANKGHFAIHLGPLPDQCRTPSQATRLPHGPRRRQQTCKSPSNTSQAKGLGSFATAPSARDCPVQSSKLSVRRAARNALLLFACMDRCGRIETGI